jgi:hypothetical protein
MGPSDPRGWDQGGLRRRCLLMGRLRPFEHGMGELAALKRNDHPPYPLAHRLPLRDGDQPAPRFPFSEWLAREDGMV